MSGKIKPIIDSESYEIKSQTFLKDLRGNWSYKGTLLHKELHAFAQYEKHCY